MKVATSLKEKLQASGVITEADVASAAEREAQRKVDEEKQKESERLKKAQADYEAQEKARVKREIDLAWEKHRDSGTED
jgi:hypothetical protein